MHSNHGKHTVHQSASKETVFHRLKTDGIIIAVLFLLSGIGIAITDFSPQYGVWYWVFMTLVFAGVSLFSGFTRRKNDGQKAMNLIPSWLFHWLGLFLALFLVLFLQTSGRMNSADAGLVSLLVVAVVTFLAGVHGDWRFGVVGILLGLAVAAATYVEEYFWMLLIPFVIAAIVTILWMWRRKKRV
ncbi:MAG: hypothetical protein U5R49_23320 [Deltaproteobacteria bacterium]|nr:hypothetical protein [Deltaproteobacteria bacterium]